ncbi:hypothetical protein [Herbaspirillum robiniae]|uniref:hypothetical protein n=1 Tax=Herbaspirillum robiniae TaxID=2014887 RepID=UPI003D789805
MPITSFDTELHQRIDEILHYLWDPIEVAHLPEARDEYASYLPKVFSLLKSDAEANDIVEYLREITTERMGLSENAVHDHAIATLLLAWKEKLQAKFHDR